MWIVQFLLGMFLAYLLFSSKFRGFLFGFLLWLLRPPDPPKRIIIRRVRKNNILTRVKDLEIGNNNGIPVDETELDKWLSKNGDLRKVNQ